MERGRSTPRYDALVAKPPKIRSLLVSAINAVLVIATVGRMIDIALSRRGRPAVSPMAPRRRSL